MTKNLNASQLQALLRDKILSEFHMTGEIGAVTWIALGRPSGWRVWCSGQWWDADDLREAIDREE